MYLNMSIFVRCWLLVSIFTVVSANNEEPRAAMAILTPRNSESTQNVGGTVLFTETDNGVRVTGLIAGLPAGKYGFHVHEMGDITTCDTAGTHFNPDGTNHGARDHAERHVGDLGNVVFVGVSGVANIDFTDNVLALRDRNNIVGRTLVLHAQEDDLGLGGQETSLTTGNAGARVACGVIGIKSPIEPWNSAVTNSPSLLLFIMILFCYFRF